MTYTGDVRVGGPSDTREIGGGLTLTKLAVGGMNNNAYLLTDGSGQGLLIDAAAEPARLVELIGDTPVAKIVTTHQHGDHWQGLAEVKAATGAITVAHPADAPGIPVPTDELVEGGGTVTFGDTVLSVIHLVGHTPGSIALVIDPDGPTPHLFTGDCLFPGGVGNTQQDKARFTSLYDGVVSKIFDRLPDETWVYPGHGGDTTLGAERPHLEEWRARGWLGGHGCDGRQRRLPSGPGREAPPAPARAPRPPRVIPREAGTTVTRLTRVATVTRKQRRTTARPT